MNCAQNPGTIERSSFRNGLRFAKRGRKKHMLNSIDRANRIATGLIERGLNPGEFVGLCAPNSADWIAFYFGVLKAGAVAVTLSGVLTAMS